MGFPHSSVSKESACKTGDPSSIPGSVRSAGVAKSQTRLSDFHFHWTIIAVFMKYNWLNSYITNQINRLPSITLILLAIIKDSKLQWYTYCLKYFNVKFSFVLHFNCFFPLPSLLTFLAISPKLIFEQNIALIFNLQGPQFP